MRIRYEWITDVFTLMRTGSPLLLVLFQMRRLVRQNLRKETRNVYDFTNDQHPDLHLSDVCTGKARKILTAAPPKNSVNP